jgi:hypothetical protein
MDGDQPATRREVGQRIEAVETIVELKFEALDKIQKAAATALVLQREIDQTHFSSLNNEAARIQAVLATTVPREVFELFRADQMSRWEAITARMNADIEARRIALAAEAEARRQELSPLRDAERFEAGRNLGMLGLAFTLGAGAAGTLVTLLTR